MRSIPFSAFWLRSSVVSVLISLISDTRVIDPHDINLISFTGVGPKGQLAVSDPPVSPWYCTTSLAGAAHLSSSGRPMNFQIGSSVMVKSYYNTDELQCSQLYQYT
ncbi:hypothetical protein MPTK1_6g19240 [Marchantia polymorpha subsp. ruderalis]|uniref:Uncharacterized protein n=2 Tax=Marchantia polymorpha TaxID=3197 RepID=A0AAF6BTQ8_MARPO|nr:hypothetical protein MARPO_0045s0139 [Marchantia polymorpha]BBN15392.1 hypothetical protein Mp_6g19240 [Marchantia polymorpha subsp. ruderalis]|eukprot:PTQ39496.1 hypothetical protein MARPO_0045s0139 [Marchantia polymorpha]